MRTTWTTKQDAYLRENLHQGYAEIAAQLGRSYASVQNRASKLKLGAPRAKPGEVRTLPTLTVLGPFRLKVLKALKPGPATAATVALAVDTPLAAKSLEWLLSRGLVKTDGKYYSLTSAGKQFIPCRNPHFAKRFGYGGQVRQQGAQIE